MNKNINDATANHDSFEEISEQELTAVAGGGFRSAFGNGVKRAWKFIRNHGNQPEHPSSKA